MRQLPSNDGIAYTSKNTYFILHLAVLFCSLNRGSALVAREITPVFVAGSSSSLIRRKWLEQEYHHHSHRTPRTPRCFRSFPYGNVKRTTASELNAADVEISQYAPAAVSLFNNMKLPAAVVTAGMISLGFATGFPELPKDTSERTYDDNIRRRCGTLRRFHIVVAIVSVTSELCCVLWSAVEVNHLTETVVLPATSVWDLIQRDCDLAWSAVNSHFVLGIIGFVTMLSLRGYVMLLAAEASAALISAASTGTAAALCLMISIVNRGVEAGGGEGIGYGKTILDLFRHYVCLLYQQATSIESWGPLQLSAIVLEVFSLTFLLQVIVSGNDKEKIENEKDPAAFLFPTEEELDSGNMSHTSQGVSQRTNGSVQPSDLETTSGFSDSADCDCGSSGGAL
mmetsp:Transcript_49271/g.73340  ORF Transcript_49271/g.73340 Transcript_49271/m.73340 type:complete len:397 (-) Transcript_49271:17-1207(-)|eukprot:CAMPEP_0195513654 /NCGR_PEP_ID=MMETSP0794_2-20130614/5258_1 /TAXON_ID=515487 /ORGANISM="Stephanopyxis turris, Strain CCMP 815" /LENGTH=396 /DNA_ID=CAMNT_0040641719 /DNA_START=100 /DNA_END=1290 /DNA_ORIENTATION=+